MPSEKARRENTTTEREVYLERDSVPKMTTHFQSLTTKDSDGGKETRQRTNRELGSERERSANTVGASDKAGEARETNEVGAQFESLADKGTDIDASRDNDEKKRTAEGKSDGKGSTEAERAGKEDDGENKQLSLEEISKLRQKAQQNSVEALKGAQERYEKAKEKTGQGLGVTVEYAKEKGAQTKDTVREGAQRTSKQIAEKGSQAKDSVLEGAQKTTQYVTEKGTQAKDTLKQKGAQAKDTVLEGAQRTSQQIAEKGSQAKGTVLEGAQRTTQYATEKGSQAKDSVVEGAQKTSQRMAEKGTQAKDTVLEEKAATAKNATGEVALDVKDRAAVTGWTAAHYTTEKTVEGTKAAAKAVQGVTEKAAELAANSFNVAKQAAVSTGESITEDTARKKEEAERGLEARITVDSFIQQEEKEKQRPNQPRASAGKSIQKPQKNKRRSIICTSSKREAAFSVPLAKL
ncbi:hypothetical protein P3X46_012381 [Hevea brasiliensis]|uniref:Seed biotin-containing protein SBP65-like n=1 Tax=Hevea brasiliensis TaxID=3981 RepID=A0ABQ9MAG1_HEVBR|nr:hypothetical protein P3X46_012381 [Hevea brasiliensis]